MDSMEKGRGPGGIEAMGDDTREFLAISGGDGDYTGVYPPFARDEGRGSSKAEGTEERGAIPEDERFPSRTEFGAD